jgi:hypothetical protein
MKPDGVPFYRCDPMNFFMADMGGIGPFLGVFYWFTIDATA